MNKRYILKLICLLIISLVLIIANLGEITYAAFSSSVKANISFKAATAKDIINIKGIEYAYPSIDPISQAYIIIEKVCDEDVIASFELPSNFSPISDVRNLSRYVTPPKNMALKKGVNRIPIDVIASESNYYAISELLNKNKPNDVLLTGQIKVYCFNKFVNESTGVQFSARHLKNVITSAVY